MAALGIICVALAGSSVALAATAPVTSGPNLIVNGDAESGAASGSGYDAVTIPGWQITGLPTVVRYGQHADGVIGTAGSPRGLSNAGAFPAASSPGPADRGRQLFVGGAVGSDALTQTDSLASAAGAIGAGNVQYTLDGWLGGNSNDNSAASVTVTFLSASGSALASSTIGPVSSLNRLLTTELVDRASTGTVPAGATAARVTLTMNDGTAPNKYLVSSYNNAYADDLSLHISAAVSAPPPPTPPPSRVGRLDHVFMVYMENEGDQDIVGNSSAPYINSLIGHYGLATNYHGIAHPSDPNYIAFFGGATYGIDSDCALACTVSEPNLADRIEAANETWKFYEQTMPSPCFRGDAGTKGALGSYYAPDELPWAYFADVADNTMRCQSHVLPLGQMALDVSSTTTTPNYVWFEADDCDDMEQCGIAAGDTWLSQTLPEILNSPAFKSQRSAIFITWDEDYNNKSFNQDNQDQQVPMIVIPSRSSGMVGGAVRSPTYYTHYSLLRTVELSLGLAPMTLNDQFATPLNDFWPAIPALSSLRARRMRAAITFRYRDSGASHTTLTIARRGRTVATFTHHDRAGTNTVRLPKVLRRRLKGRYSLRATASNAAGLAGAPVSVGFKIAR